MDIYFISSNEGKCREVAAMLGSDTLRVHPVARKIEEIQSVDMARIAEDKAVKGFKSVWRPVLVEQAGLLLEGFGDLPGGFTQSFWEALGPVQFSRFFSSQAGGRAVARSVFAYCDGRQVRVFEGSMPGRIIPFPESYTDLWWGSIFLPDCFNGTYAELPLEEKKARSMRGIALEQVRAYLGGGTE